MQRLPPAAQPQEPGLAQPPLEDIQAPQEQQVKVALVLPLTGRLANLGQAMSEASQMAMFDLADRRFELIPLDDQGTPKGSEDAARQAVAQGARIILGPLLASSVRAVTPIAAQAGIPVVAFSSDRKVASPGIYIIGFTPEAEVERVVAYATSRGLKRFAALAPDNDPYGAAVADALRKAVASNGGTVVRIDFYDAKTQDFSAMVRKLTGAPDPAATPASSPFGPVAMSVPPVPAFDALLIAEGGPKLRTLGATLGASGIGAPGVQLLGTGKWDEPGIGAEPSLVGAWFAAPAPAFREEFEVRYKQTFGKTPPRLATLAYDATALAAVLARGPGSDPFSPTSMVDANGFFGRDGLFRLTADGQADQGGWPSSGSSATASRWSTSRRAASPPAVRPVSS